MVGAEYFEIRFLRHSNDLIAVELYELWIKLKLHKALNTVEVCTRREFHPHCRIWASLFFLQIHVQELKHFSYSGLDLGFVYVFQKARRKCICYECT